METMQSKENLPVALPVDVYIHASTLELTAEEQEKLMAAFDDQEYEIRPDGHIYIPQALIKERLNKVIGVGQWALVKIMDRFEQIKEGQYRMFFDGALMIRGKFASRSVGESTYYQSNANQSWASALEAAKSDTIVRCCKDLGIADEIYKPAFVRKWQKAYAVKVFVKKEFNGVTKNEIAWRRKDVEPFFNETGPVPTGAFSVPEQKNPAFNGGSKEKKPYQADPGEKPWLNEGPDYHNVVKDIEAGKTNMEKIRSAWRLNKAVASALDGLIKESWKKRLSVCKTMADLTKVYNDNKVEVDASPDILKLFTERRSEVTKRPAA